MACSPNYGFYFTSAAISDVGEKKKSECITELSH